MNKVVKGSSIWTYIRVGTCLRYLQDRSSGNKIHGGNFTLTNINYFLNYIDELGLNVTKRASKELENFKTELEGKPKDAKLSVAEASRLKKIMEEIRLTFVAESKGISTYIVADKRLDTNKLLDNVSGLFSPGVFEKCSDIARYDFEEAGKCIAFERPTAAAFHILRGTEATLKLFYKKYIRPAQPNLTWGQMTTALRAKARGKKPDLIILNNLDHIRISFRNPTQHPEKIYDIQEVQDLYSLCIDGINRMIKAINP